MDPRGPVGEEIEGELRLHRDPVGGFEGFKPPSEEEDQGDPRQEPVEGQDPCGRFLSLRRGGGREAKTSRGKLGFRRTMSENSREAARLVSRSRTSTRCWACWRISANPVSGRRSGYRGRPPRCSRRWSGSGRVYPARRQVLEPETPSAQGKETIVAWGKVFLDRFDLPDQVIPRQNSATEAAQAGKVGGLGSLLRPHGPLL